MVFWLSLVNIDLEYRELLLLIPGLNTSSSGAVLGGLVNGGQAYIWGGLQPE